MHILASQLPVKRRTADDRKCWLPVALKAGYDRKYETASLSNDWRRFLLDDWQKIRLAVNGAIQSSDPRHCYIFVVLRAIT